MQQSLIYYKMRKTIGSVESFTGGLFASEITNVPGSSAYYRGSLITYSSEIKNHVLRIDVSHGVISKETALEMTKAGRRLLDVDYCVSFTGNAGPTAMDNKPVGLVYVAINDDVYELQLKGTRKQIKKQAVDFALEKVAAIIAS